MHHFFTFFHNYEMLEKQFLIKVFFIKKKKSIIWNEILGFIFIWDHFQMSNLVYKFV